MKKIKILAVGKLNKDFCRDGFELYIQRLKRFYEVAVVEIPEQPTKEKEGELLLKHMSGKCVLMDVAGKAVSSEELSELVASSHLSCDELTFVIGGAFGVSEAVRDKCGVKISFGRVTYPHQVARMLLAEQLYRAATILNRIPYHH